jgi:hypothetical protein
MLPFTYLLLSWTGFQLLRIDVRQVFGVDHSTSKLGSGSLLEPRDTVPPDGWPGTLSRRAEGLLLAPGDRGNLLESLELVWLVLTGLQISLTIIGSICLDTKHCST